MAESVGVIYYTVEAETQKLLDSVTPTDQSLGRLQKTFERTDKAANQANFQMTKTAAAVKSIGRESQTTASSLGGLTKLLGGVLTLQGANALIQMAESYREMGERIRFATSSQEEYEEVQRRLLATANGTYRSLAEAQEVYILTADSLRSMGYSTEQALDITDSLSYAFVKNATSVERGANATRAYSNAIMKGKVEADGWSTIISAVPSIIQDIAAAAGLSAEEVRKMGAEGKLTAQMLNEGLRQSLESNKAAADGMATTVRDAFNNMRNSLSVFLGESQSMTTATGLLSNAILLLGNNIETVVQVLMVAGAGALARYIASTGAAALQSAKAMLTERQKAVATLDSAQATEAATLAEVQRARTLALTAGGTARAAAAERAYQAALAGTAAAQRAVTSAGSVMVGMLGGPVGIAAMLTTAAFGMYAFRDGSDDARRALESMDAPLEEIIQKFGRLNDAQRSAEIVKNIKAQALAAEDSETAFNKLLNSISSVNSFRTDWSIGQWRAFREEVQAARNAGQDLTPIIKRAAAESGVGQDVINEWIEFNGNLDTATQTSKRAVEVGAALAAENTRLANATRDAASGQRELNDALNGFSGASGEALAKMQERVAAMQDGNSEVKKAERYLATLTDVSEEFKTAYMSQAYALDANTEAVKRANAAKKGGVSLANEQKRAEEENAKTIAKMAEAVYQAGLSGEALAAAKARASLNEFATKDEIEQLEQLARVMFQIDEANKARSAFSTGVKADEHIMGQTNPLSGGAFDDQYARYEAEAQAEQERYAAQLERLQQARELQIETQRSYDQLEEDAARQHADRMAQIDQAKQQVMLSSASDAFGALADVMKQSQGEQSGIYKAMFAASKAFAIAESIVKIQQGIAAAAALPFPANIPAMAQVAAATAGIISTISSASMGSGRQYGGPVGAGKMYRINETGAPEILNTASGQQFLLPNTRGKVVSNKDATQGNDGYSRPTFIVNLIEDASRGGQIDQRQGSDGEEILDLFAASIRQGGKAAQAVEYTYGLTRQGR